MKNKRKNSKTRLSFYSSLFLCLIVLIIPIVIGCPADVITDNIDEKNTEVKVVLESIYISQLPKRIDYGYYDVLDLYGLEVIAG